MYMGGSPKPLDDNLQGSLSSYLTNNLGHQICHRAWAEKEADLHD
jgi:hypothetical protein